jgi:hypothetical protein
MCADLHVLSEDGAMAEDTDMDDLHTEVSIQQQSIMDSESAYEVQVGSFCVFFHTEKF